MIKSKKKMNLEELRQKIVKKYGSIHNFCKLNENLTRAAVYLVFAEKYAGNTQKQLARIKKALDNSEDVPKKITIEEQEVLEVLQQTKCSNCRLLRPNCQECKRKSTTEANAVYNFIQTKL